MPVNSKHKEYQTACSAWTILRHSLAGEEAIKAAGEKYLPRLGEQEDDEYESYTRRAEYWPVAEHTRSGLVGTVYRKDPSIALSPDLEYLRQNADGDGTPLALLAKEVLGDVLGMGRAGLLTDAPAGVQIGAPRPYIKTYAAEKILNWRIEIVRDVRVLTRVVLEECFSAPAPDGDEFCDCERRRYRVLDLVPVASPQGAAARAYRVRLFVHAIDPTDGSEIEDVIVQDGDEVYPKRGLVTFPYIPFTFVGPASLDACVQKSPLLDLVRVNLHHYLLSAELNSGLFLASMPQACVIGGGGGSGNATRYRFGLGTVWEIPMGGEARYLEYTGTGLEKIRQEMQDDEERMRQLGGRLLEAQKKAAETAEALRLRQAGEDATLATTTNSVSFGIQQNLAWAAEWVAADPKKNTFDLNRDFTDFELPMADVLLLGQAADAGYLTDEDLYHNLRNGERLSPATTRAQWMHNRRNATPAPLPALEQAA